MPRLTVVVTRLALLHLLVGFTAGAWALANKAVPFAPSAWRLVAPHIEVLLIGWMVQLALAVAYWILPRRGGTRPRAWLAALAAVALNAGVIAAATAHVTGWPQLLLAGRALQLAAAVAFALHAWPRVSAAGAR